MSDCGRVKAALLQMPHGDRFEENLDKARAMARRAAESGARIAVLPEYFFATFQGGPETAAEHARAIREMLAATSRECGLILAANLIERREAQGAKGEASRLVNLGVVYDDGRLAFEQPKIHPMPREAASGVHPGDAFRAGSAGGRAMGMLVCADVLYPEAARVLALQGVEVLLNPVMSPFREDDLTRGSRDAIFVARAYDSGAFVLKAGGFRRPHAGEVPPSSLPERASSASPQLAPRIPPRGPPPGIAGRSLIAAPWGVLAKARDDFTEEIVMAELDFATLERFRLGQGSFPARRPDAYRDLTDVG